MCPLFTKRALLETCSFSSKNVLFWSPSTPVVMFERHCWLCKSTYVCHKVIRAGRRHVDPRKRWTSPHVTIHRRCGNILQKRRTRASGFVHLAHCLMGVGTLFFVQAVHVMIEFRKSTRMVEYIHPPLSLFILLQADRGGRFRRHPWHRHS